MCCRPRPGDTILDATARGCKLGRSQLDTSHGPRCDIFPPPPSGRGYPRVVSLPLGRGASVTTFLSNDTLWQAISARINAASRIDAAIAYFGEGGAKRLPLRNGHRRVVDMSPATVRAGGTDPRASGFTNRRASTAGTRVPILVSSERGMPSSGLSIFVSTRFLTPRSSGTKQARQRRRGWSQFWDTHDLTDFKAQLEEVAEPVFMRGTAIKVPLESHDVEAVEQMARAKGVSREELIRAWVLQKLSRRSSARPTKR